MPQDTPDAVSPLAPIEGSYRIPGFDLTRRWFDAGQLSAAHRTALLDLIRVAFNDQPSWFDLPVAPEDHFDWKFRDCPLGVTAVLTVDPDDRIVGFIGRGRRTWLLAGRPYVARWGYDLSQLPEWQGRGVQRAIEQMRQREWHPAEDCVFGQFTHPANRRFAVERGGKLPANPAHDFVRPLRRWSRLRIVRGRRRRSSAQPAATPVSNTAAAIEQRQRNRSDSWIQMLRRLAAEARVLLARRPAPRAGPWTIASIQRFEADHEPFLADACAQFDFVGERSVDYLNWRFCDRRAGPFTVRVARRLDDGALLGYAATLVLDGRAHIADVLVRPGYAAVAEALIRDAVQLAANGDADSIAVRLPRRHPYRFALDRAGFFDAGPLAGETIEPRDPADPAYALLDRSDARIHYVFADSDTV